MAKVRRETYSCTGRGFSKIDADGYMARLLDFCTRPNVHGTTQAITSSTHASDLFTKVSHGYITGQAVALTLTGSGALPVANEFTASTSLAYPFNRLAIVEYFVIKLTDDTFQLAATHYNAMLASPVPIAFASDISGTSVNITALGGGANWYLHDDFSRVETHNFATTDVNTTAETITLAGDYFSHMHKVTFSSTTTVPAPLVAGTAYWLIRVSSGVYSVASTEALAFAGTAINLTSQGTGTHTVTTDEHFVIVTDTLNPVVNDYNTSPAGVAPKFLKLGYQNTEAGYVRMQGLTWWDKVTHTPWGFWFGKLLYTYDSALFAYQFIGGDEFLFQASQLGATWYPVYVDTFTGISSKLEAITKVGILQSGVTAATLTTLPLAAGQASDITVGKFYYLYDFQSHCWVNYVKVDSRNTVADTVTVTGCTNNFPAGAVITSYAHRYYAYGAYISGGCNMSCSPYNHSSTGYHIPYVSSPTQMYVFHPQNDNIYSHISNSVPTGLISVGTPDDEGNYDCIRFPIMEDWPFAYGSSTSMNRLYAKSNNVLATIVDTMGQMTNTRTLLSIDYLYFFPNISYGYAGMITYSESDT